MTSGSAVYRQIAPDVLEVREGGGCLSLFGVPFLVAGLFVALIGLRVLPVHNAADVPTWAWPLLVLVGLVFVTVGGGLVFGRQWIRLDAGQGRATKQWGLVVPLRHKEEHLLSNFESVAVRFQSGDSDSADSFPVVLKARDGLPDVRLSASTTYEESRQSAGQVARFLRLPLVDAATDHESIVETDRVDASLAERVRASSDVTDRPVRPLRMRSQVEETATQVRIRIPGPGFRFLSLLGIVVPAGILSVVVPFLLRFFEQTRTPPAVQVAFLGFLALCFGVIPLVSVIRSMIAGVYGGTIITASPDGLIIEERGAGRARRKEIRANDVLDVDYGVAGEALSVARHTVEQKIAETGGHISARTRDRALRWATTVARMARSKGITVKSRHGLFTFGAGLPDDEIRYLRQILTYALIGEQSRRW
jgi:hypothetical protein